MEKVNQSAMNQRRYGSRAGEREDSRPKDWSALLGPDAPVASEEFMKNVEDLPMEERWFFANSRERPARGKTGRRRTKSN
jgi:hypothetical protein